jgi:hypothetical protein
LFEVVKSSSLHFSLTAGVVRKVYQRKILGIVLVCPSPALATNHRPLFGKLGFPDDNSPVADITRPMNSILSVVMSGDEVCATVPKP